MADVYQLTFTWRDNGKLGIISCDEANVPKDEWAHGTADFVVQLKFNEVQTSLKLLEEYEAALTVNKKQSVRMPRGRFLYMDVGRWLDGHQSFGLVCGEDALVCEYVQDGGGGDRCASSSMINQVVSIPGVRVLPGGWQKIIGPHPDPGQIMVILPDCHVPAAPPSNFPRPDEASWPKGQYGSWKECPEAWDEANQRDFFNSRRSIPHLITFLSALRKALVGCDVVLVQIGDLYELWAGHPLEYVQSAQAVVNLKDDTSADTVGNWIWAIHDMHNELFLEYDKCKAQDWKMIFLHGNHDSYLSRPEVIAAAEEYINDFWATNMPWGGRRINYHKTTVYPRIPNINLNGVFMEHGQRVDGPNRDGNTYGYEKTNQAFHNLYLQEVGVPGQAHDFVWSAFDSTRRRTFVAGAASRWVVDNKSFGLYVMGHTHSPELKYIEVVHQKGHFNDNHRGDITVVPTGTM